VCVITYENVFIVLAVFPLLLFCCCCCLGFGFVSFLWAREGVIRTLRSKVKRNVKLCCWMRWRGKLLSQDHLSIKPTGTPDSLWRTSETGNHNAEQDSVWSRFDHTRMNMHNRRKEFLIPLWQMDVSKRLELQKASTEDEFSFFKWSKTRHVWTTEQYGYCLIVLPSEWISPICHEFYRLVIILTFLLFQSNLYCVAV